mgnify:FL=1
MLDHSTEWISLAYEQAVDIDISQYKFWTDFIGSIMGVGVGVKDNKNIINKSGSTPTTAELMAIGIKRKK